MERLLWPLDLRLQVEIALNEACIKLKAHRGERILRQALNLGFELSKAINARVGPTCQFTELVERWISHFKAIAQGLSETKCVQVLVPSKGLLEKVRCSEALRRLHELVYAGGGHLGAGCE